MGYSYNTKVVVNAKVSTGLYPDSNGFCKLFMDNHYSASELFVMVKTKYKILAYGTVPMKGKILIKR